jgi:hypothetical protein
LRTHIHVLAKIKGDGQYQQKIFEVASNMTHANAIVLLLILMEWKGMITSALDVYEGREELYMDQNKWESPQVLAGKLERALEILVKKQQTVFQKIH